MTCSIQSHNQPKQDESGCLSAHCTGRRELAVTWNLSQPSPIAGEETHAYCPSLVNFHQHKSINYLLKYHRLARSIHPASNQCLDTLISITNNGRDSTPLRQRGGSRTRCPSTEGVAARPTTTRPQTHIRVSRSYSRRVLQEEKTMGSHFDERGRCVPAVSRIQKLPTLKMRREIHHETSNPSTMP